MSDINKRKRTRVQFETEATIAAQGQTLAGLSTTDVSLNGLFVETGSPFPLGAALDITLKLAGASSSLELAMKGKVTRVTPKGMAVEFTEIDMDSFFHLRNIIYYNSGDPSQVDEEVTGKPAF